MRLRRQFGRAVAGVAAVAPLCGMAVAGIGAASPVPRPASHPSTALARVSISPEISIFPNATKPQLTPVNHPPVNRPDGTFIDGYHPAQIRAAYFLNPLLKKGINGKGTSIVIVDSFGSPTIRHDLGVFDRAFKLPAPPALSIIHPAGPIPKFNPNNSTMADWAAETTLDVEWAHVMAPDAKIVLAETPTSENEGTSGFPQIVTAEKYVIEHHLGDVISQSFGATEETFGKGRLRPLRGAYLEAAQRSHDITVLGASGDAGATDLQTNESDYYTRRVTSWPASDPLVTAVGGLDVNLSSTGTRNAPDRVWNDPSPPPSAGGGGLSIIFGRPAFQNGVAGIVGKQRGVPDISLSASCTHPVAIFATFDQSGWNVICGTSEATPLFAGLVALAAQVAGRPLGPINGFLYKMAAAKDPGIVDVTRGNNTVVVEQNGKQTTVKGWNAVRGYDLASGLGTINAKLFVPELAALAKKAGT
ncbi:MAG TPA: S53 family peptidase [Streptosporangiaceae bacterium]|nr:S53 family peptidase [Streptosporangiaceae bacterium]